jgi:hypothetical protein
MCNVTLATSTCAVPPVEAEPEAEAADPLDEEDEQAATANPMATSSTTGRVRDAVMIMVVLP